MGVHRYVLWICVGQAALLSPAALAETTTSFQVSATIVSGCEINGALATGGEALGRVGTLDFGTYSALATGTVTAAMVQDAGVTLSCTPGVALTMSLDGGLHASTSRNLQAAGSSNLLAYRLYHDAGLSQELAIDQAVSVSFSQPDAVALPVYGKLTLSGDKPPDTYSDTILLTLSW